jgi:N-acetylmuramic acid 6-phosphate etherase
MTIPPDRSHLPTEQRNPRTMDLHALSASDVVARIQQEDRAVLDAVERARAQIVAFIEAAEPGFASGGRLVYLGAGTSGRLGVLDASEAPPTFDVAPDRVIGIIAGGDPALRRSSEGKEDDPLGAVEELRRLGLSSKDALLGIAAGGTTPYVLGGLEWAASLPSPDYPPVTGILTCSPIKPPAPATHVIVLETGPEVITGSTRMKAGTATKLVLNTISTTLMVRSGRVYQNLMVDVRATNQKLRDRAARIVATLTNSSRSEALALLEAADFEAKTAVLMGKLGVSRSEAQGMLAHSSGHLGRVLDAQAHPPEAETLAGWNSDFPRSNIPSA